MGKHMSCNKDARVIFILFYKPFILFENRLKNKYFYIKGMITVSIDSSFLFFLEFKKWDLYKGAWNEKFYIN